MAQGATAKKKLILTAILATILILAAGWYSALQHSEPKYLSKIDRLMYDTHNQSPKYVITLPERQWVKKVAAPVKSFEDNVKTKPLTPIEVLGTIPMISKLEPYEGQHQLKFTEPDPALTEKENDFILPKTNNNRKPWVEYGEVVPVQPNYFRVAILIKNLGLDLRTTDAAFSSLPSEVSFSFSPYAPNLPEQVKKARAQGHETYADLLLSSKDFLKSDTGPMAMSITTSVPENMERLHRQIGIKAAYGGMVINPGVADNDNSERIKVVLEELKKRGLLILDATGEDGIDNIKIPSLARRKADFIIDSENLSQGMIEGVFAEAEEMAKARGQVLIVADPKPVVLFAILDWVKTFSPQLSYEEIKEQNMEIDKPFVLVPASNLVVE